LKILLPVFFSKTVTMNSLVEHKQALDDILAINKTKIEHPDIDHQNELCPYLAYAAKCFKQLSGAAASLSFVQFIERELPKYLKPWPFIATENSPLITQTKSCNAKQMFSNKTFLRVNKPLTTHVVLLGSSNSVRCLKKYNSNFFITAQGKKSLMQTFAECKAYEQPYCLDFIEETQATMYFDNFQHNFKMNIKTRYNMEFESMFLEPSNIC